MIITIDALTFNAIIGILDFERTQPQRVIVTCKIEYTYSEDDFVDYAQVSTLIQESMQREKFGLIETALLQLSQLLKERFSVIEALELTILKPDIIDNATVGLTHSVRF